MYLFGIDAEGIHHLGSSYTQRVNSNSRRLLMLRAERMKEADSTIEHVYSMKDYTQKMSEMGPDEFVQYIVTTGTQLI